MNRNKEFFKNTIILFIGKFATQFMSLLLLPLFTHYLLSEDYGLVDLLQTYISLFIPVLTLRIDSSLFRFLIDKRNNETEKKNIISNVLCILFVMIIPTVIISIILLKLIEIKYFGHVIINLIILMISSVFLQILRGLGKNKEYSIASIITGLSTLIINILLILIFDFGADSILISSSISNILCILYVTKITDLKRLISLKEINKGKIKETLAYSLPMIPNSLSWWIVNVSDRTIISFFIGTAFNGIYTVSCKFSNILNSIYSIFNMSWQETATLHINDEDKDYFFSDMINKILFLFSSFSLLIIAILPLAYDMLIGNEYIESYNYIPLLLYANSWNVLIGLIGGIYVAKKRTKEIANTTIMSAIINIIIHIVIIKKVALYAACISTLVSYMLMGIYRYIDCKKYVKVKLDIKNFILFSFIFLISSILYFQNNMLSNFINIVIVMVYFFTINRKILSSIWTTLNKKVFN